MSTPPINITGLGSGLDTNAIISALMAVERQGLTGLNNRKSAIQSKQEAYRTLNSNLVDLRSAIQPLLNNASMLTNKATFSNTGLFSATVSGSALAGVHHVSILQRATSSVLNGTSDIGKNIDAAAALNSSDGLGSNLKAGTFTVNGSQITVNASDSLNTLLSNIQTAMGGASVFQASYDSNTDKVALQFVNPADGPLVLGSASDTSNVLSLLKLTSDGAGSSATSSSALGRLDTGAVLNGVRSRVPVSDGGSGAGKFTVNGVEISFNAGTESLGTILSKINASSAGVNANYDSLSDRIVLTNKAEGSAGIFVQDVTGNFASALGLTGNATLGKNAQISIQGVNGGNPIISSDNVFTTAETGIAGLTLTVQADSGNADVTVAVDPDATAAKFQAFVDAYNKVMTFIQNSSKVSGTGTSASRGPLNGEQDARIISMKLRSTIASPVSGITSGPSSLSGIGISTSGADPKLTLDKVKLAEALQNNPSAVQTIVADPVNGVLSQLKTFIDAQSNYGVGPLAQKPDLLNTSITRINKSIADFNRRLDLKEQFLRQKFGNLEQSLSQIKGGVGSILTGLQQV